MQRKTRLSLMAGITLMLTCVSGYAEDTMPETQKKIVLTADDVRKLSETFGHLLGRNLDSPGLSFDLDSVIKGIQDGAAGREAPMSDQEYEALLAVIQEKAYHNLAEANLKEANTFMSKNTALQGIIELEPGLIQYEVLQPGEGCAVTEHSAPMLHYTGKYLDDTVFSTSEGSGGPVTIPLDQTIPGFSKALVGMKEGEKRRIYVHPDRAFGTNGNLPPNSLLLFEVELVKATDPIISSTASVTASGPQSAIPMDDSVALEELQQQDSTSME